MVGLSVGSFISHTPLPYLVRFSFSKTLSLTPPITLIRNRPNPELEKILNRFEPQVKTNLITLEKNLSEKFVRSYCNGEPRAEDFARLRLDHGVRLFYRLFECIIKSEATRCGNIALKNVICNVDFISATFAMSLEIVLNSYGTSDRKFPWILGALNLHAFFVSKVIETIIMHDTGRLCNRNRPNQEILFPYWLITNHVISIGCLLGPVSSCCVI